MRTRSVRPLRLEPSPRGFVTICKFNLEVTDDITIYNCSLVRAPDGRTLLYGPASTSGETLSTSPEARRQIIEMALDALESKQNDQRAA